MSYIKDIDHGHRVTFRDEQAYLACRLDFLNQGYAVSSFSSFVELTYRPSHSNEIENVEHLPEHEGFICTPYVPLFVTGPIQEDSIAVPQTHRETSVDLNTTTIPHYYVDESGEVQATSVEDSINLINNFEDVYQMGVDKANGKDKTVITKIEKPLVKKISRFDLMDMEK